MATRKVKLNLGEESEYNPYSLLKNNERQQLVNEYRRLRNIALKRLDAIRNSEYSDSRILDNKEFLDASPSTLSDRELAHNLSLAVSFLNAKRGSLTGLREADSRGIETLQERGYTFINKRNYREFGEFMESLRVYIDAHPISSDDLVELFGLTQRKNINPDEVKKEFEFFLKNRDEIDSLKLNRKRTKSYSASELRAALKKGRK